MPYKVVGEARKQQVAAIHGTDFRYKYPNGLDLKPGSELHEELKDKILERAQESRNVLSKRFDSWNEIDRLLTAYVTPDDDENEGRPATIVFPYTYAMLEALLTYLSLAFFQDPIFIYEGCGPEDIPGAMLLELVVRMHCLKNKAMLAIHTALRDALAYGVGISVPGWERKYGRRPIKATVSMPGGLTMSTVEWVDDLLFEGNRLDSIDPYMWLPDPSVSVHNVQEGEFVGWIVRDNYYRVLEEELRDGNLFNAKYLSLMDDCRSSLAFDVSERSARFGTSNDRESMTLKPVDKIYMYVHLIPKEWKLGKSEWPEKWLFCLAGDEVILTARRSDLAHDMYPIAVAAPEYDGYSMAPISRMEILQGLQTVLDWLFNSHITNVRKAINDMFIVDPYLVNIDDLADPKPGKIIRLRRPAWGKGVDKVIQQFAVADVTRQNIADSAYITQWMDRISGADQSMFGIVRTSGPERLTKSEFQSTRGSAVSRLQRLAMIISLQYFHDIGTMFAFNTQQFMSRDTFVRIAGRHAEQLSSIFYGREIVPVTIDDLAISYDVIVRDGSIPGSNFSDAWIQLFNIIASHPELAQQFDVVRIFTYIATQLGAKNVEDFKRQVMPDENVLREVEKGNLRPI